MSGELGLRGQFIVSGGPCFDKFPGVLSSDSLPAPSLLAGSFYAGQQFNLAGDLFQRSVLRKLSDKINDHLAVAHSESRVNRLRAERNPQKVRRGLG